MAIYDKNTVNIRNQKVEALLQSSERELIYYIHFLQYNKDTRPYFTDVDYTDFNKIKSRIKFSLFKAEHQNINTDVVIDDMLNNYTRFSAFDINTHWLQNDKRACMWLIFNILTNNVFPGNKSDISRGDVLNMNSGSIYFSILAWIDKTWSKQYRRDECEIFNNKESEWLKIKRNEDHAWLLRDKDDDAISYCYDYLKSKGTDIIRSTMSRKEMNDVFDFCETFELNKKTVTMAFFDYIYGYSDNGNIVADNLRRKMSSGLSSWKNRKNKEEYSDLHFDIKKENIPKLEDLRKTFNLSSKKDVVNELIELFHKQHH